MFEIERMDKEFDYSLVDNETADFLRSCEYEMNGIAEDARIQFGRVLNKAQDRLAKHGYGVFQQWVESGGISLDDAYYYINLNRLSRNLDEQKRDNFLNAPKTLQKEVMKKNAPEELRQKVFDGDIKTNKEYQDLLKERNEAEQRAKQAEQQAEAERRERERLEEENEKLANQEPKVIEKVVEDKTKIKELTREINQLKIRLEQESDDAETYRKLRSDIERLSAKKDDMIRRIESAGTIGEFIARVERAFTEDLAPIKYTRAIRETSDSPAVIESVNSILETVEEWVAEIRREVPELKYYTEVIEHE